ncbi:MAG: bifunctional transaldolase/phosoglucose isomerase [Chloroflexi bacterium]|nr:bifunctional transaldolase/phosoglucose isomerase [Chloroflexota bacterium]
MSSAAPVSGAATVSPPTRATANPLVALAAHGQSIWLDYIRRNLIAGGELQRLVQEDELRGVTSNPAIFEKAIAGSTDYAEALQRSVGQAGWDAQALYEQLAIRDIQDAADVLRPVYDRTRRRDGYVSLEVSPRLAHDTAGTIAEARRLWQAVGRENVMIKVPATPEGLPAITQLIGEGINVNVTLLFALARYEQVAAAYCAGLERLAARRGRGDHAGPAGNLSRVASVASFFVSRVDTAVDAIVATRLKMASAPEQALLRSLAGKVAIANAKLAYHRYKELLRGERWQALAAQGAQTQRLLWASTSTKNPSLSDVLYVEELIGPDTVNTMPPATLDAYRDHGRPRASLEADLEAAQDTLETLERLGISLAEVTDQLLDDGVRLFVEAFDKLLSAVEKERQAIQAATTTPASAAAARATTPGSAGTAGTAAVSAAPARRHEAHWRQTYALPDDLGTAVQASLADWQRNRKVQRLWAGDASLWTTAGEESWLGWLGITEDQLAHSGRWQRLADEVQDAGLTHLLVLGMGGSSLCPDVVRQAFGRRHGFPELHVLDSTDPAQIKRFEESLDLARTLCIVSSKSGTTLEPNILKDYFFERVRQVVGPAAAGGRFIAITDPGSKLQQVAESDGFRHVFYGLPSIGGRYSALSDFGMVPAAAAGVDVRRVLDCAEEMVQACAACVPAAENPGVVLGTILGVLARHGRDKVTIAASPGIAVFGAWLEQLLAESTGKQGMGLIPVDREPLGPPAVYGRDRLFVYVRLESAPDAAQDAAVDALERARQPVVRIAVRERHDLGGEYFHWEIATAVAGAIIGVNPFDQPDVETSKVATRKLTAEFARAGALPAEAPILEDGGIKLFADARNAAVLAPAASGSLAGYLRTHLSRLAAGDYFALLVYLDMHEAHERPLQTMRQAVRDAKRVATCLGFGPRFLHSTGQVYKGGPNTGVFLQLTCDDALDLPVPGQRYTFGVVKAAQARGDFQVLAERQRRALRVHLGKDVPAGLAALQAAITQALA